MGFIVKKKVDVRGVGELDQFYVRVDKYTIYRNRSSLDVLTGHFNSVESAASASGIFFGDYNDYSNQLPTSMSVDGNQINYNPRLSINLGSNTTVEPYLSSSIAKDSTPYIDFDDEGNEIEKEKVEYYQVEEMSTVKLKKDISIIADNIYEFAYEKLKEKYKRDFDPCKIEDA
jgi:hypothetical protein